MLVFVDNERNNQRDNGGHESGERHHDGSENPKCDGIEKREINVVAFHGDIL